MSIALSYKERYESLPKTYVYRNDTRVLVVGHFGDDFHEFVFDMKERSKFNYLNLSCSICSFVFSDGSKAILDNKINSFTIIEDI